MAYKVVPVNPRTGNIIKRPRRKQSVVYDVIGPRGGRSRLYDVSQEFYQKDIDSLNSLISRTSGKNFVVYEQLLRKKDPKTKKRLIKITGPNTRRKQRPVLFTKGKIKRNLDIGFKKGHSKRKLPPLPIKLLKPNVQKPFELNLVGPTIKRALSHLQVNMSMKDFVVGNFQRILYFTCLVRIVTPKGEVIKIPVNDSYIPQGFSRKSNILTNYGTPQQKLEPAMQQPVEKISNIIDKMAYSIRRAILQTGYSFTSMVTLNKFVRQEEKIIKKLVREDYPEDFIERKRNGVDALTFVKGVPVSQRTFLTKNYEVKLYVRFELY